MTNVFAASSWLIFCTKCAIRSVLTVAILFVFSATSYSAECLPGWTHTSHGTCIPPGATECRGSYCPKGATCGPERCEGIPRTGELCPGIPVRCMAGFVCGPNSRCYDPRIIYACNDHLCAKGFKYAPDKPCAACQQTIARSVAPGVRASPAGTSPQLSPALISVGTTPAQAAKLLEPPPDAYPRGVYKLDREYNFNVLDAVSYDAEPHQISLMGHRDEHFAGSRIPYLQHLATLLENPKPQFSLTMTPETLTRIDAFFKSSLSPRERDRISTQLGVVLDGPGNVTPIGRYMLPAIGIYPAAGNKTPGYLGVQTQINKDGMTVVTAVTANSPAAKAGIIAGDFITFFDDGPIVSPTDRPVLFPLDLARRVRFAGAGSTLDLTYQRGLQPFKKAVTLTADSTDPWLLVNRYSVVGALYREAGNEAAARVIYALGLLNDAPKQNPAYGAAMRKFLAAVGMSGEINNLMTRQQTGGGAAPVAVAFGRNLSQRLDDIFAFPGYPVLAAYNANIAKTRNSGPAIAAAFAQFDVALKPKVSELLDRIFNRPEGIQIAPELIESIFHVRPEMTPDYRGVLPNTLLARAMFDGDYLIKRLVNRPDLKLKIPRYQTVFEFKRTHAEPPKDASTFRTWISLAKMDAAQSPSGDTLEFHNVQMRFNIRELGKNGTDLPSKPGGYEELLTSLYDDFAHEYPTLNELREAEKLAAVATWLRAKTPSMRLSKDGAVTWRGPAKVPGLVFVYLFKRGETPRIDMLAEGGINLEPFPNGLPPQFLIDSSVVDLRGLAAGGPAARGTPLSPLDPSIVDLRGLSAGGQPEAYRRDLTTILGQPVNVVVPPPVGARTEAKTGKGTFEIITATLNSLSTVDAERALEQRDKLEKARRLAVQLWVTERALSILTQNAPDWAQQLQGLQDMLANQKSDFKLLAEIKVQNLSSGSATLNALRAGLLGQKAQLVGQVAAALADPALKPGKTTGQAAVAGTTWSCAAADTNCTNQKLAVSGSNTNGPTSYSSAADQLTAAARKRENSGCVFEGQPGCEKGTGQSFAPPKPGPHSAVFNELAARIAKNPKLAGDSAFQDRLAWYQHLDGQLVDAKANLASVQQQIDSGKGDKAALAAQKQTIENTVKQVEADTATAKKTMDDQAKKLNLSIDWPTEAPPAEVPPSGGPASGASPVNADGNKQ